MAKQVDVSKQEPGLVDPRVINPGPAAPIGAAPGQPPQPGDNPGPGVMPPVPGTPRPGDPPPQSPIPSAPPATPPTQPPTPAPPKPTANE